MSATVDSGAGCAFDRKASVYSAGAAGTTFFYDKSFAPCARHDIIRGEAYDDATETPASDFPEAAVTYP